MSDDREGTHSHQPSLNSRYDEAMGISRAIAARRYGGSWSVADREDLVSEVMIKYWLKFGGEDGPEHPRAWLSGVLTNTAVDMHRAQERRPVAPERDLDRVENWLDGWLGAVEHVGPGKTVASAELIEEVLGLVSDQERELLTCKYLYRQSTADIADQVGKTVDATSQALRRAKVSLSAALSAEPGLLEELRAGMPRPY